MEDDHSEEWLIQSDERQEDTCAESHHSTRDRDIVRLVVVCSIIGSIPALESHLYRQRVKHGHGLLARPIRHHIGICCGVSVRVRVEEIVVIIALLNHPNDNEDDDVQEVFLNEETSDGRADTWSMQAAIAIDCRVNGHYDVE